MLAFAYPMFRGQIYIHSDLGLFHLPFRHFFAQALSRGHSFIWCPFEFTGFYLHGEGQVGMYHPLNQLSYRFLPLALAFNLELIRNYVFLLLGTYLLLRRRELQRDAAVFGALLFTFSSFHFIHFMHINFVAISAHIPWLLLALDVAVRSTDPRRVSLALASLTLLTASQLLLSHPQVTWMSLFVEAAYAVFLLAPTFLGAGAQRTRRQGVAVLASLAAALALGFLVASVQLLPMWESLENSQRAVPSANFTDRFSLHPINALQLVAPYLFLKRVVGYLHVTPYALYCGAAVPVLVTWLLLRRGRVGSAWPLARASLVLALVGFLLAMGADGQLYRLQQLLPVIGLFRAPSRYILVCQLGLCVASAVAFADLVGFAKHPPSARPRRLWPLAVPLGVSLLASLLLPSARHFESLLGFVGPSELPTSVMLLFLRTASPGLVAVGPLLVAIATALVLQAARGRTLAAAALILLTAADLGVYGMSWVREPRPVDPTAWLAGFEENPPPDHSRLESDQFPLVMREVRLAGGYAAMVPRRILPIGNAFVARLESRPAALRVASVWKSHGHRVPDPLPRARLVTSAVVSDEILHDLRQIDPKYTALVARPLELQGGPPGTAAIHRDDPGDVEVETRAPGRQLLVLSESYHNGWTVTLDGDPREVVRAYGDFIGCVVGAGRHQVRFRFEPRSLQQGKRLSGLGLGLTLGWLAFSLARPQRRSKETSGDARASLRLT